MNSLKEKKNRNHNTEGLVRWLLVAFIILIVFALASFTAAVWDRVITLSPACLMSETCMESELNVYRAYAVLIIFVVVSLTTVFMLMVVNLLYTQMKKYGNSRDLKRIMNGISTGIAKIRKEQDKFVIVYANEGFYNMQGYTKKEYTEKYRDNPFALLNAKDSSIVREGFDKLKNKECVGIEYRITIPFEKKRWILVNVQMNAKDGEKPVFMCTFTDITKHKRVEDELLIGKERLSLILEKIDNLIMEYDLVEDEIHCITEEKITAKHMEDVKNSGCISEEDYNKLCQAIENCKNRRINQTLAIRYLYKDENKWYEFHITTLFDSNDEPVRALVRVSDVDTSYKEKVALIDMSQREAMTGLYNKPFAEKIINEYMCRDLDKAAVLMIDIDDFKKVNDTLGHAYGDSAIKYVASELQNLFRSDDVVARIGGDEFLVYMRNLKSMDSVISRARAICEAFARYQFVGSDMKISCSIGIAIYDTDGTTFNELLEHADKAMYACKRNGKNDFKFFKDIESENEQDVNADDSQLGENDDNQ